MEKNKLSVGQTVWYYEGRIRGSDAGIVETKVSKVGRVWFEVECCRNVRFEITSLKKDSQYTTFSRIYLSEKDYNDEVEMSRLNSKLQKIFQWNNGLSLEKLRAIDKIISE